MNYTIFILNTMVQKMIVLRDIQILISYQKYPVIISGYSTISGIDNWTTLTFTFIYLTDFFKDEDC